MADVKTMVGNLTKYKMKKNIRTLKKIIEEMLYDLFKLEQKNEDICYFDRVKIYFDTCWFSKDEMQVAQLPIDIFCREEMDGRFIYSINLGELRSYIENGSKPSSGEYYDEWKAFAPMLRDKIIGEDSFAFLMNYWGFLPK